MYGLFVFQLSFLVLCSASIARADIVGGADVKPLDPIRKSTAALYEPSPDGQGGALCTASVIGPNTAVTAAHCVSSGGTRPVMIFGDKTRSPNSEMRPITGVAVNPRWKTHRGVGMDQGDIAVVKFGGGLPEGYQPVPMMQNDSSLKKGETAVLAGYGISNAKSKAGAGVLRKAAVKIEDSRKGKPEMILDQTHGKGACHGDSGGPAFVRQGGRPVLAGVTNRGYPDSAPDDCAHKVVYTKVSAYRPWIRQAQNRLGASGSSDGDFSLRSKSAAKTTMRSVKAKLGRRLPLHSMKKRRVAAHRHLPKPRKHSRKRHPRA